MSDASVLINKSMRLISAKMKDSVFSIKLEHTFLQGIFNDLSEAQNKAMILEAKAVNKCEECGKVIRSENLVMLPSGRIKSL